MGDTRRRSSAAVVALVGVAMTAAGLVWAWQWYVQAQQSELIQSGPTVAAAIVATGEVRWGRQDVTLRYEDGGGRTHEVAVRYPLGLGDDVPVGSTTSVVYDPQSPARAELEGLPRRRLPDAAAAGGVTLSVTGMWLLLLVALRASGAASRKPQPRQAGEVWWEAADPAGGAGVPGPTGWEAVPLVPPSPETGSRSSRLRAASGVAGLLVVVGTVGMIWGLTEPRPAPFAPPPPKLAAATAPVRLPAVLSPRPPSSGPLVTPEQARQVFETAWRIRDEALFRRDAATLRALETGPALEADIARLRGGDPPNRPNPGPDDISFSGVFVPRQDGWPVHFMAQAVTTSVGVPFLEVLVFVREGPHAPWQVAFNTGMTEGGAYSAHVQTPILDDADYNVVPDVGWISAEEVMPALARYWQSWVDQGAPPVDGPAFAEGLWTTHFAAEVPRQGEIDGNGLAAYRTYDPAPAPAGQLWTYGIYDEELLVCSPIRDEVTWEGRPHQDANRSKWHRDLPPGVYATVTVQRLRQPCVIVPSEPGPLRPFGADNRVISISGKPAAE